MAAHHTQVCSDTVMSSKRRDASVVFFSDTWHLHNAREPDGSPWRPTACAGVAAHLGSHSRSFVLSRAWSPKWLTVGRIRQALSQLCNRRPTSGIGENP